MKPMSNPKILSLWQEEEEKEVDVSVDSTFPAEDVVFNVRVEIFPQRGINQFRILSLANELL